MNTTIHTVKKGLLTTKNYDSPKKHQNQKLRLLTNLH